MLGKAIIIIKPFFYMAVLVHIYVLKRVGEANIRSIFTNGIVIALAALQARNQRETGQLPPLNF